MSIGIVAGPEETLATASAMSANGMDRLPFPASVLISDFRNSTHAQSLLRNTACPYIGSIFRSAPSA